MAWLARLLTTWRGGDAAAASALQQLQHQLRRQTDADTRRRADAARTAHDLRQPLAAAQMQAERLVGRLQPSADAAQLLPIVRELQQSLDALARGLDEAFDAPAPAPDAPSGAAATPDGALHGALVALVDDDDTVRAGLQAVLAQAGAFVVAAPGRAELLVQLQDADRMPDLIVTDWRLPAGDDGRVVIEALRRRCYGRDVPALVLTADAPAAAAGLAGLPAVQVLRKPVAGAALLARLEGMMAAA